MTLKPLPDAVVTLVFENTPGETILVTDDHGEFSLRPDQSNPGQLRVEREGYRTSLTALPPDGVDAEVILAEGDEPQYFCRAPTVDVGSNTQGLDIWPDEWMRLFP